MNKPSDISFELLKAYAENKLSAKDATKVELALKDSKELRAILNGYLEFKEKEAEPVDAFLDGIKLQTTKEAKSVIPLYQKAIIAISSVAAISVLLVNLFSGAPSPEEYDFKDAGTPVLLNTTEEQKPIFNTFMNAYKVEDYEKAQTLLKQMSVSDTTHYYQGVLLKEHDQFQEALRYFEQVPAESVFHHKAEYQTALCLWYLDDERYFQALSKISKDTSNPFQQRATEALAD